MRRFVFGALAVVALSSAAACSGSAGSSAGHTRPHVQTSSPANARLAAYLADWLHFRYPASWTFRHGYSLMMAIHIVDLDLSNQAMHNPCTTDTCGWPVSHLGPGGVFVEWADDAYPATAHVNNSLGVPVTIGGRPSRQAVSRPGDCSRVGGAETITVQIPADKHNIYVVTACMRGPHLARTARQVQAFIASVSFPGS